MEIINFKQHNKEDLFDAFQLVFKDYEMQLSKNAFLELLKRRGFFEELSFAAIENGKICSFIINGIGKCNGLKIAYDIATGTLPYYRGRGLTKSIFNHAASKMIENNIQQYILEVLKNNTKAQAIYIKEGFEVTRHLNYYIVQNNGFDFPVKTNKWIIQSFDLTKIQQLNFSAFWDFVPSWQNNIESIIRAEESFQYLGVSINDRIVGYLIFDPTTGDVAQLAVSKNYRRQGIATALMKKAQQLNKANKIKILNIESTNQSLNTFLKKMCNPVLGQQLEMIKTLQK